MAEIRNMEIEMESMGWECWKPCSKLFFRFHNDLFFVFSVLCSTTIKDYGVKNALI